MRWFSLSFTPSPSITNDAHDSIATPPRFPVNNWPTDQFHCARVVARLRTRISVSDEGNCVDTVF